MGWIKRNLFFVGGGILALALLAAAGIYDFQSLRRNIAAKEKLSEIYGTLRDLNNHKPSPGNDKIDNITAAREQERQVRVWLTQTTNYFQPIAPIPAPTGGGVTSEQFANALRRTIHDLQQESASASVLLPPDYSFSFTAQRTLVKFAPGSPQLLAAQLGEVKAISEIFFAAHVNSLDGIQRLRVSDDDSAGPQADYLDDQATTSDLAVLTPYEITFRSFGPEVAQVIANFASSPHGFIIKGVNVEPAATPQGGTEAAPPPAAAPVLTKGGLQIVLDEKLLSVTLVVEVVKLSPKN
jgi:hypothetical protein